LNCLINYSTALAVAECRIGALIAGLDVGVGLLHADAKSTDSLVFDLVEPLRPEVERFCLDLIATRVFHRGDFLEQPDGSVRLGPALLADLTTSLPRWAEAAGPVVERVAHSLADGSARPHPEVDADHLAAAPHQRPGVVSASTEAEDTSADASTEALAPTGAPPRSGARGAAPIWTTISGCGAVNAGRPSGRPPAWPDRLQLALS
jgi:hypothetical protein